MVIGRSGRVHHGRDRTVHASRTAVRGGQVGTTFTIRTIEHMAYAYLGPNRRFRTAIATERQLRIREEVARATAVSADAMPEDAVHIEW